MCNILHPTMLWDKYVVIVWLEVANAEPAMLGCIVLKCWDCLAWVLWSRQFNTDLHAEMTSFKNFETGQLWNAILPLKDVSSKINLEKVNINTLSNFYSLAQVQLEMYTTPWLLSSYNLDCPERERESRFSYVAKNLGFPWNLKFTMGTCKQ